MKRPTLRPVFDRVAKFRATQYVLPTFTAAYFNRFLVPAQRPPTGLPDEEWAHKERHELLQRSEERLRGLEGKGPGLATVTAIIAAGVIVAVQGGWDNSEWPGRALLIIAAVYAAFSLVTPIYLVGPQMRSQLGIHDLEQATQKSSPENWLAGRAAEAAASNTDRTIRLANLQTGARNELVIGFIALALWVVLVPATGALRRSEHKTCVGYGVVGTTNCVKGHSAGISRGPGSSPHHPVSWRRRPRTSLHRVTQRPK